MSSFTPPSDEYGQMAAGKHPLNRLMAHYGTMPRGRNVYFWSDGSVSETDPDSMTTFWTASQGSPYVVTVWWGSTATPYKVTAAQAAALTSAGYTVSELYVDLTGASGTYVSTPDDNDYTFTNFEIVARVALDDWTPASNQAICSIVNSNPNRNWRFYISPTGQLALDWFPTGLGASQRTGASSAPGFVNGTAYWVKVVFEDSVAGNNRASFYYAADQTAEPTSWTAISSSTTGTSFGGFPNVSQALEIGSGFNGGSQQAAGNFYRVIVRNGIDGTEVADFHPDLDADSGDTSFASSTTGETWTLHGSASIAERAT